MPPKNNKRTSSRRPRKNRNSATAETKTSFSVGASVGAKNFHRSQGIPVNFGRAHTHEDFPEGGIRIAGSSKIHGMPVARSTGATNSHGPLNDPQYSMFASACSIALHFDYDSNSYPAARSPFPAGVTNIAYNFMKYRIRSCTLRYVPSCPTTTSGRLDIGYMKDAPTVYSNTSSSFNAIWNGSTAADLPADQLGSSSSQIWASQECRMRTSPTSSADDELFYVNSRQGSYGDALSDLTFRSYIQGAFAFYSDVPAPETTLTTTTFGAIYLDYVVDFYGFNASGVYVPALSRPLYHPADKRAVAEAAAARDSSESKAAAAAAREDY